MPLLKLQTSQQVEPKIRAELLPRLSRVVADLLAKPEAYVMVVLEDAVPMLMGGTDQPSAMVEVRAAGDVSPAQAKALSSALTDALGGSLDLAPDRIFANFVAVDHKMWGYNGATLG